VQMFLRPPPYSIHLCLRDLTRCAVTTLAHIPASVRRVTVQKNCKVPCLLRNNCWSTVLNRKFVFMHYWVSKHFLLCPLSLSPPLCHSDTIPDQLRWIFIPEVSSLDSGGICLLVFGFLSNERPLVRFQVRTAASMMFRIVFWNVLPCKIIVDRRFRGAYCLHHQG
jgi:hypothetical protein